MLHAIAAIGAGILKALKIAAVVGSKISAALAIPATIAGKIAIKAGVSAATAARVTRIASIATALATDLAITKATQNLPKVVKQPIRAISDTILFNSIR